MFDLVPNFRIRLQVCYLLTRVSNEKNIKKKKKTEKKELSFL